MNYGGVRLATAEDAEAMLGIYAPYVRDTAISFEYEPPAPEEFRRRVEETLERYPWLVFEINGKIVGYAYAGPNYTREAYQWTAEASIYVPPEEQGRGIAKCLYDSLFDFLSAQGFYRVYAIITGANARSLAFHKKCGFAEIGRYENAGYKLGSWWDVYILEKVLREPEGEPAPVIPVKKLSYWECTVESDETGKSVVKDERRVLPCE